MKSNKINNINIESLEDSKIELNEQENLSLSVNFIPNKNVSTINLQ